MRIPPLPPPQRRKPPRKSKDWPFDVVAAGVAMYLAHRFVLSDLVGQWPSFFVFLVALSLYRNTSRRRRRARA